MENTELELLKYPIGRHTLPALINEAQIKDWISALETFPAKLKAVVNSLNADQLALTYRPGGWTVRQVIHHLADSHTNAFIRVKLILTEENPTIKPYFEERWAEIPEAKNGEITGSVQILEGLHQRMCACLKDLSLTDFDRTYFHPEHQKSFDLKYMASIYAWHGVHHLAQINSALLG